MPQRHPSDATSSVITRRTLERAGILSWVNRLVKVRVAERDLFGRIVHGWRVLRTSNAYVFRDPGAAKAEGNASKSKFPAGRPDRDLKQQPHAQPGLGETADALLMRHGWFHGSGKGVQRA
jgi:hypothetical protein